MDAILRAAGDLLGTRLSDPVDLGGGRRSTVLRCRTAAGGSVIVKSFTHEPDALRSFASEAAGLDLRVAGPALLGVDTEVPLRVLEDLGAAPTPADVLLGDDPKAAAEGLLTWAAGLGRLAAASVHGRADFTRLTARYDKGLPSRGDEPWIERNAADLLPRTAEGRPMHRTRRPVPTMRQVLLHRWEMASRIREFPAFADTTELLLRKVAGGRQAAPLPGYPAFGG